MKNNKKAKVNGWIFVDKPLGISSNRMLQKVKRLFLNTKAGYVGTLDPMATGFLPIALGKATRTIKYLEKESKEYIFTIEWGVQTSTGDLEGNILNKKPVFPQENNLSDNINNFKGKTLQKPHKYSAIKINGKRAYNLARDNKDFELMQRSIEIFDLEIVKRINERKTMFYIKCSSGVYIRSLAEDLATSLGTYGHVTSLRRIGFGNLNKKLISLDSLISLMHIDKLIENLKPVDHIFEGVSKINLGKDEAKLLLDGKFIVTDQKISEDARNNKKLVIAKYKKDLMVIGNINGRNFYPKTIMNFNTVN